MTDRVTRILFYGCLVVAAVALAPVVSGAVSLPLMVIVLLLVYEAWRLAVGRQLRVRLDEFGITKSIGRRTWQVSWSQVTALRVERFLGTGQLVLRVADTLAWDASDRLFWKLGRHEAAVQVPDALAPQVRDFLSDRGLPLS